MDAIQGVEKYRYATLWEKTSPRADESRRDKTNESEAKGNSTREAQPAAKVHLSEEAMKLAGKDSQQEEKGKFGQELSEEEKRQVEELKTTDRKVRAHEQAHIAAGGTLVRSGANYSYTQGPDGKQYAVAGEVQIDTSPEDDPRATIQKAARIRAAALAPADPSAQDRSVAAKAEAMAASARAELASQATGATKTHRPVNLLA